MSTCLKIRRDFAVLVGVRYPDMPIAIDGDALRPSQISRPIPMLSELAEKISVGIKNLNAIVHRIRHVDVAFFVQRDIRRRAKISGCGQPVILAARSNPAEQLQRVGVKDEASGAKIWEKCKALISRGLTEGRPARARCSSRSEKGRIFDRFLRVNYFRNSLILAALSYRKLL